jgi:hypothetical protein
MPFQLGSACLFALLLRTKKPPPPLAAAAPPALAGAVCCPGNSRAYSWKRALRSVPREHDTRDSDPRNIRYGPRGRPLCARHGRAASAGLAGVEPPKSQRLAARLQAEIALRQIGQPQGRLGARSRSDGNARTRWDDAMLRRDCIRRRLAAPAGSCRCKWQSGQGRDAERASAKDSRLVWPSSQRCTGTTATTGRRGPGCARIWPPRWPNRSSAGRAPMPSRHPDIDGETPAGHRR